jgi:hypothetical protein
MFDGSKTVCHNCITNTGKQMRIGAHAKHPMQLEGTRVIDTGKRVAYETPDLVADHEFYKKVIMANIQRNLKERLS